MAEYIISDKQYAKLIFAAGNSYYEIMDDVAEELENNEIVRCKDCKHWKTNSMEYAIDCHKEPESFFCALGERRAD